MDYKGFALVFASGRLEGKEEKFKCELLTLDGESLYQWDTTRRNMKPDFKQ